MSKSKKGMAVWSTVGSRWPQRAGLWFPAPLPTLGCFFPTIHLTAALLLVWLGGESDRGAENQLVLSVQVIFTRSVCVGAAKGLVLAPGGVWEYMGGPGCTRLTSEAADVAEKLLTVN